MNYLKQHLAALRLLLVMTVVTGIVYPLAVTAVAQIPGLHGRANGSVLSVNGKPVGSKLLGQAFTDKNGNALVRYFQSRPSAAGSGAGYDANASGASNLGPESIVDVLPNPKIKNDAGTQRLLTQVCSRSKAVGVLEGVDGMRPYCTPGGAGAVLAVFFAAPGYAGIVNRVVSVNEACPAVAFMASYKGVKVECGTLGEDYSKGQIVPIRGIFTGTPAVPADAVTASGSGLDPQISPAYAKLQVARVAKARGATDQQVQVLVARYTTGRGLGFLGEPGVNVLELNLALDRQYPHHP